MLAAIDRLRARHQTGRPVRLAVVFRVAGLTRRERHVVSERLRGRSYGSIAGRDCSRQAVQIAERKACRRLGLAGSVETVVHAIERADRGREKAEQARATSPTDLHGDGPARCRRKPTPRERVEARLDRLADQWVSMAEQALEREAALRTEADRLAAELARLNRRADR